MNTKQGLTQGVAEVLTAEKAIKRITYDSLVEATGISRSQVIRYFKGTSSMKLAELEAICDVLGLDALEVMTGVSQRFARKVNN